MTHWTDEQIHEFWKTHDSGDYWDEMEPVEVHVKRPQTRAVSVKLEVKDIAHLRQIADEMGVGHTTLIRMWIKEKLKKQPVSQR